MTFFECQCGALWAWFQFNSKVTNRTAAWRTASWTSEYQRGTKKNVWIRISLLTSLPTSGGTVQSLDLLEPFDLQPSSLCAAAVPPWTLFIVFSSVSLRYSDSFSILQPQNFYVRTSLCFFFSMSVQLWHSRSAWHTLLLAAVWIVLQWQPPRNRSASATSDAQRSVSPGKAQPGERELREASTTGKPDKKHQKRNMKLRFEKVNFKAVSIWLRWLHWSEANWEQAVSKG